MKSCTELIDGFPVNHLTKKVVGDGWNDCKAERENPKNSRERRMELRKIKHVQLALNSGLSIDEIEKTSDLDASVLLKKLKTTV